MADNTKKRLQTLSPGQVLCRLNQTFADLFILVALADIPGEIIETKALSPLAETYERLRALHFLSQRIKKLLDNFLVTRYTPGSLETIKQMEADPDSSHFAVLEEYLAELAVPEGQLRSTLLTLLKRRVARGQIYDWEGPLKAVYGLDDFLQRTPNPQHLPGSNEV